LKPETRNQKELRDQIDTELLSKKQYQMTFSVMTGIVQMVACNSSLQSILESRKGNLPSGSETREILGLIATLGTWLTHTAGRCPLKASFEGRNREATCIDTDNLKNLKELVIPKDFHPKEHQNRDISKPLASIVYHQPDTETLSRFYLRTYLNNVRAVSYPLLSGIWAFSQNNRLQELVKVSNDPYWVETLKDGIDLLEVAIQDANTNLQELLQQGEVYKNSQRKPGRKSIEKSLRLVRRSFWMYERELGKIRSVLENLLVFEDQIQEQNKTQRNQAQLERIVGAYKQQLGELRGHFKALQILCSTNTRNIENIQDLTLGEVQRIAQLNSIDVEDTQRQKEQVIRENLINRGFANDLDVLVPMAVSAHRNSREKEFWQAIQQREDKKQNWLETLTKAANV